MNCGEDFAVEEAVYCIHYNRGCTWNDCVAHLRAHLMTCSYDVIGCTNDCGDDVQHAFLDHHLSKTCRKRKVSCDFCSQQFSAEEILGHYGNCDSEYVTCQKCGTEIQKRFLNHPEKHAIECPEYAVSCPCRCDSKIPRRELNRHLQENCPSVVVRCSVKHMGCEFKGPRSAITEHMKSNSKDHECLMFQLVGKLRDENAELTKKVFQLENFVNRKVSELEKKFNSFTFLWKIAKCSQKMEESKTCIFSEPFYTGEYGYRLRAFVYPNGDRDSTGTHLSLFVQIMRGEYDAMLSWPFRHKITLTLCDQASGEGQDVVRSLIPDPTLANFQRPCKEKTGNKGRGFQEFVSHDDLRKNSYIKDDIIFIKIQVEANFKDDDDPVPSTCQ